jgi:hypothetical protein
MVDYFHGLRGGIAKRGLVNYQHGVPETNITKDTPMLPGIQRRSDLILQFWRRKASGKDIYFRDVVDSELVAIELHTYTALLQAVDIICRKCSREDRAFGKGFEAAA